MRKLLFATVSLLLLSLGSAFAQDVRYNFDKSANFSKYKTYKWVELKGADKLDDLTDRQIRDALDAELARKGLTKTDAENADLYIGYQTTLGQEKQFTSYSSDWGYGPGWGRGWYGGMGSTTTYGQTSTIYTGQLAVDMYDSGSRSLVWRGVVSKTLDPKAKPEKRQKNLAKATAKLLKNYPPLMK